jgi:hypothetical protein
MSEVGIRISSSVNSPDLSLKISVVEYVQFHEERAVRIIHLRGLITILLSAAICVQSCAFEYEPSIPPIDWGAGPTSDPSGVSDLDYQQHVAGMSGDICAGDETIAYCKFSCPGQEDEVCTRICWQDYCYIFHMTDPTIVERVNIFTQAVDRYEQAEKQVESLGVSRNLDYGGIWQACTAGAAGGLVTAGRMLQQGPPSPAWLVTVGVIGTMAALGACVFSGARLIIDDGRQLAAIDETVRWMSTAFDQFQILEKLWWEKEATR